MEETIDEIWRVLQSGGALAAIEPDYGGLMEYPREIVTRELWLAALFRAGANPFVGRRLPGLLSAAGFSIRVDLLDQLLPADKVRLAFLKGLALSEDERRQLLAIEERETKLEGWSRVAHLPFYLISARRE